MTRAKGALALLTALLLALTACGGQPAQLSAAPSATPSGGSHRVEVHWDMLEQSKEPLARRWHEGYTGDLIPAAGYGELVPYIGNEIVESMGFLPDGSPYVSSGWLYGLATGDGVVVTDPVYDAVYVPGYTDAATGFSPSLPLWVVTRAVVPQEGEPYTAAGVAARDGSWYTGLVFYTDGIGLQLRNADIRSCEAGLLMGEAADSAVMIGLDGFRLYRWTADDFPPPDPSMDVSFSDRLRFGLESHGRYWSYSEDRVRTVYGKLSAGSETLWLDAYTGELLEGRPADAPEITERPQNRYYFTGGWYDRDDPATLHFDDGTSMATPLWEEEDFDLWVSPPFLALRGEERIVYARLDGEILFQAELEEDHSYGAYFLHNQTGGPTLFRYTDVDYQNGDTSTLIYFGPDGRPVHFGGALVALNGETAIIVDDQWYRLTDLEGNDLLRLPRLAALDRPADD